MKKKFYPNKKLELIFNKAELEDFEVFNNFVESSNLEKYNICEKVILYCRYRLKGIKEMMTIEEINLKTGISKSAIQRFLKYMTTEKPSTPQGVLKEYSNDDILDVLEKKYE